jgi:hypothetical protein
MNFVSGMLVLLGFALATDEPQAAFPNWTMVGGLSLVVLFALAEIAAAFQLLEASITGATESAVPNGTPPCPGQRLDGTGRLDRCRARMSARSYQFLHRGLADLVLERKHSLQEVVPVCMHDRRIAGRCRT